MVRAGEAQVRAVGTEFDVYRKQAETVVTVVEGRVETIQDRTAPRPSCYPPANNLPFCLTA